MRAIDVDIDYLPSIVVGIDFCYCNWRLLEHSLIIVLRGEGIAGFDIVNGIIELLVETAIGWLIFL